MISISCRCYLGKATRRNNSIFVIVINYRNTLVFARGSENFLKIEHGNYHKQHSEKALSLYGKTLNVKIFLGPNGLIENNYAFFLSTYKMS